ncbi:MAG: hypothetical protein AAF483_27230 [Planctomycetota bacterium]
MENVFTLEAPFDYFDQVPVLLNMNYQTDLLRQESRSKDVRRLDIAEFTVTSADACVDVWMERRLGNKRVFLMIVPRDNRNPDGADVLLGRMIVGLFLANGAFFEA